MVINEDDGFILWIIDDNMMRVLLVVFFCYRFNGWNIRMDIVGSIIIIIYRFAINIKCLTTCATQYTLYIYHWFNVYHVVDWIVGKIVLTF